MKIAITQEDAKNSGEFDSTKECALAKVMQKTLNNDEISVGFYSINDKNGVLGEIIPGFTKEDYNKLVSGEIKEFVTEYIPI